jgi:hypothetical protein
MIQFAWRGARPFPSCIRLEAAAAAFSAILFLLAVNAPASAQFVCTTTATDVSCTNSGTAASELNFDLTKNVTTYNYGTVTTSMSSTTGNSGNATTTNWGSVGTDIDTTVGTVGDARTTNYGSVGGSVSTFALSGSSVGINYGTIGTNFGTTNESGGIANAINYGSVGGAFTLTGVFDSTTLANYGSVGSISVSSPNGGTATATNTGSVRTSITTLGTTGATTLNYGSVGTSISTQSIGNGAAVTTNWGSVGTSISTLTASGGAVIVTNYGRIGSFINATSAIGGDATVTSYGFVGGNIQALAVFGTATAANYGTAGSLTAGAPTGNAFAINTGAVLGQVTVSGQTGQTLTNSGTISNSGGTAILFIFPAPTMLTLLPGSFIVGNIDFAAGATNTIHVGAGNLNLTFNTLAGATVTGSVPFAVSGNQVASVDPTPFAMIDRNLMDFSRSVSSAVPVIEGQDAPLAQAMAFSGGAHDARSRIEDAFAGIPGLSSYANDRAAFANSTANYDDGWSVWARGFAGARNQPADGILQHVQNQFYGGMLGVEKQAREHLRIGVFAGAGESRSIIDLNYGNSKSDTAFAGTFARYSHGILMLQGTVQGGHSANESNRTVNNNLLPGGLETATASYGSTYFSPEATVALHIPLGLLHGAFYTLTPSVNLRYLFAAYDPYTETGSTANLSVAGRNTQNTEERAQLTMTSQRAIAPGRVLVANVFGGIIGVQRVDGADIDATLLGQEIPFAAPGKDSVIGGFGGAGVEWRSGRTTLFGSIEYTRFSDSSSVVSGRGGVKIAF